MLESGPIVQVIPRFKKGEKRSNSALDRQSDVIGGVQATATKNQFQQTAGADVKLEP